MINTKTNRRTLQRQLREYQSGKRSKSQIEREDYGVTTTRGGFLTRQWRNVLGEDTVESRPRNVAVNA